MRPEIEAVSRRNTTKIDPQEGGGGHQLIIGERKPPPPSTFLPYQTLPNTCIVRPSGTPHTISQYVVCSH